MVITGRWSAGVAGALLHAIARAQDVPVPEVPLNLPAAARQTLLQLRREVIDSADAHNERLRGFTGKCGPGKIPVDDKALYAECEKAFGALSAEQREVVADKKRLTDQIAAVVAAVRCEPQTAQIEKDKEAIRRLQRTNDMGGEQLREWMRARREAEMEFVVVTARAHLSRVAAHLSARQASANAYKGWLTRYENQLRERSVPLETLLPKVDNAISGFHTASREALAGRTVERGLDVEVYWDYLRTRFSLAAKTQADADADIKAALEHPLVKKFVDTDVSAADALRSIADLASTSTELARFSPHYTIAEFLVDNGFNTVQWIQSLDRIRQQGAVSEQMYLAFKALDAQLVRSRKALSACRAAQAPGVGSG